MHVLSGGAAAAVVQGVQAEFEQATGSRIDGTFSAVGMMRDKLVAGAPCDVVIFTQPLIEQLIASGHVGRAVHDRWAWLKQAWPCAVVRRIRPCAPEPNCMRP